MEGSEDFYTYEPSEEDKTKNRIRNWAAILWLVTGGVSFVAGGVRAFIMFQHIDRWYNPGYHDRGMEILLPFDLLFV